MNKTSHDLAQMLKSYERAELDETHVRPDRLVQFQHWFDAAVHAKALEANAMTLATVGEDGGPSTRVVLLEGHTGPDAAGKVIELDLMNADQKAALPEDEEITAADRLVIESPSEEGIVLVRAHVPDRGMREVVRRQLEAATCTSAN